MREYVAIALRKFIYLKFEKKFWKLKEKNLSIMILFVLLMIKKYKLSSKDYNFMHIFFLKPDIRKRLFEKNALKVLSRNFFYKFRLTFNLRFQLHKTHLTREFYKVHTFRKWEKEKFDFFEILQ